MTCARVNVTDYDAPGHTARRDLTVRSAPLSETLTMELEGAATALGLPAGEVLLASLARAVERTIGGGVLAVDVTAVDVTAAADAETIDAVPGAVHPVTLTCAGPDALSADDMLFGVHHALAALALHRTVYGRHGHGLDRGRPVAEVLFAMHGGDTGPAGLGHRLEVHAYRRDGVLVLDWWFDPRCFESYSVEELAEQLPHALVELTSEAAAPLGTGAVLAMAL